MNIQTHPPAVTVSGSGHEHRRGLDHAVPLAFVLLLAFALRVLYLTEDRFHADEALYAGWALRILGGDPLLLNEPVDKPPLFLYVLAVAFRAFGSSEVAARWPNLACSMAGIALVYRLGNRFYGPSAGRWAALFLAVSPFDILFARTAFTDPMLVMWALAALCAAANSHWLRAGLFYGLALATKQHAVVLLPLVIAVGLGNKVETGFWRASSLERFVRAKTRFLGSGVLGFSLPFAMVTWWDSARWAIRPGYWEQSTLSYGGLAWTPPGQWLERLVGWLAWARYLPGSTLLSLAFALGAAALLVWEWRHDPHKRQTWMDTLWIFFILIYLLFHTVLNFSIWDRYLLPLAVPVALLGARMVTGIMTHVALRHATSVTYAVTCAGVLLIAMSVGLKASVNGYPVGGEHWAYQGIDQVATYLKQHAAPDAILYHHWLRWHYSYYLHGTDFELRWWRDGEHLRQEARKSPEREQYIVLPDWCTLDPKVEGVRLVPILETRRRDGSVSLQLCRIEVE